MARTHCQPFSTCLHDNSWTNRNKEYSSSGRTTRAVLDSAQNAPKWILPSQTGSQTAVNIPAPKSQICSAMSILPLLGQRFKSQSQSILPGDLKSDIWNKPNEHPNDLKQEDPLQQSVEQILHETVSNAPARILYRVLNHWDVARKVLLAMWKENDAFLSNNQLLY